jgi:hypothetical protein
MPALEHKTPMAKMLMARKTGDAAGLLELIKSLQMLSSGPAYLRAVVPL